VGGGVTESVTVDREYENGGGCREGGSLHGRCYEANFKPSMPVARVVCTGDTTLSKVAGVRMSPGCAAG